ncbi:Putative serine-threonine/tyrosine-protein kinase catalytic domain containing protein [Klebsormidium nitens]|uniref:Putative serine-threonine/tyrosine-protein kinase catalytic domain containing protein n=1 Tax=Klebsormidium nitens TaxID=105231 RepID=A0A1Y1I863_KLENI|nr:Putative serine-threonine/tyrosine-protein kinase catalytic domain containing protein [Klebsormidium nitens]|eukprot:GAQ87130.1 Putative serine-threonine/tyrosine-protein kinase catalytic domain containing protein [Klebsormidium nitens]
MPVALGSSYPYLSGLNNVIVPGQLTLSYFDYLGGSLSNTQECLWSNAPMSNGSSNAALGIRGCLKSTDFAALGDKWSYNYSSCAFQYWGASNRNRLCLDAAELNVGRYELWTAAQASNSPPGYSWYSGYDLNPDSANLVLQLLSTSCTLNPCGSCKVNQTLLCGANNGLISNNPANCAQLCNSLSGCGCAGFVVDPQSGCCYLKNVSPSTAFVKASKGFDAYVRSDVVSQARTTWLNTDSTLVRVSPCTDKSCPFDNPPPVDPQQWIWNGTSIKLLGSDLWLMYNATFSSFYMTNVRAGASQLRFVIPLADGSGTDLYTPQVAQNYGAGAGFGSVNPPYMNGCDTYGFSSATPASCSSICSSLPSCSLYVFDLGLQGHVPCCFFLNASVLANPLDPAVYGEAAYLNGSVYNSLFPTSPPSPVATQQSGGSNAGIIAGIAAAISILALLFLGAGLYCLYRKRKRHQLALPEGEPSRLLRERLPVITSLSTQPKSGALGRQAQVSQALGRSWREFTRAELEEATGGFAKQALLGEGAFGQVFLAVLPDGERLAIKQLKAGGKDVDAREFLSEINALGRVRHRNLVSLRGYCVTDVDCSLVLDYAENGNLGSALSSRSKLPLDWDTRMNIAVGAARGLSYLHNDTEPRIIHRDVKSANILLDANMQAKVADFGLAKLVDSDQHDQNTMVRGTFGYLAPEMVYTGKVTPKSDVFSFGVVLLEIASGFRAIEVAADGSKQNLVEMALRNRHQLLVMIDSRLNGQFSPEAATQFLTIALSCVARDDGARPNMSEILFRLESISKGTALPADHPPPHEDSGSWVVGSTMMGPGSSSDGLSSRSHSTWSQPNTTSDLGHSFNYQMTMIQEGR